MSAHDPVVWSEGLFLRPAHFQQQQRHVERLLELRCQNLQAHGWGFARLVLDAALLRLGKLAIAEAEGLLPDGTPFCIPHDQPAPPPLDIGPATSAQGLVHLALPVRRATVPALAWSAEHTGLARHSVVDFEAPDVHTPGPSEAALLQVARLRLQLLPEAELRGEHVSLAVARVVERRDDGQVVLDEAHLPPALDCRAVPALQAALQELRGLLQHRAEALAARVSSARGGGLSEVADFLLLQLCQRAAALFHHLATQGLVHPERFYAEAVQLAAELATYTQPDQRAPNWPPYRHHALQDSFQPVLAALRRSLSMVFEQSAVALPLELRKYGIRVSQIADRSLLGQATLVLAAKASLPAEALRQRFPAQAKVGAVEQIRDLVNLQLPGVALSALPVAPRELPYHAGCVYFELQRGGEAWQALARSGGVALHVSGDFPDLELAFWAVRAPAAQA